MSLPTPRVAVALAAPLRALALCTRRRLDTLRPRRGVNRAWAAQERMAERAGLDGGAVAGVLHQKYGSLRQDHSALAECGAGEQRSAPACAAGLPGRDRRGCRRRRRVAQSAERRSRRERGVPPARRLRRRCHSCCRRCRCRRCRRCLYRCSSRRRFCAVPPTRRPRCCSFASPRAGENGATACVGVAAGRSVVGRTSRRKCLV